MENKIIAKVDGREITQKDMDVLISHLGNQAMQFANPEGEKRLLDELINEELFYSHGKEIKADEDEAFKSELEKAKISLIKQYMIGQTVMGVKVEDGEVEAYYEAHKNEFTAPETVNAHHILIDDETKANDIIEEINGGLSFEDAAKKYSSCPSKEKGGDLGFFGKGQMVPEFEEASFALELNQISEPVKTQFGYHIIKVVDRKEASSKGLEEMRMDLLKTLTAKKQSEAYLAKVAELKSKYTVEIL
ncbi:peptidylprolyl isomerase [Helicovermis profundi]|uniref:Peptidylprolyl isomerase n=1 Tax=Helicovermis profundi TaxID=3065157 RepID=A0AAU9E5W4_9FIRM|nr:peptidylprolyl isomerase [Clostridia bacterium S502]